MQSPSDRHLPVRFSVLPASAVLSRQAANETLGRNNALLHLAAI